MVVKNGCQTFRQQELIDFPCRSLVLHAEVLHCPNFDPTPLHDQQNQIDGVQVNQHLHFVQLQKHSDTTVLFLMTFVKSQEVQSNWKMSFSFGSRHGTSREKGGHSHRPGYILARCRAFDLGADPKQLGQHDQS